MSIAIHRGVFEDRNYYVCLPASYLKGDACYPVIYVQDGDRFLPVLEDILNTAAGNKTVIFREHIIVGVIPGNRLDDYTPWSAPAIMNGLPDFGGLGDGYLNFLANGLKSHIDTIYRTLPDPLDTCIIGASLGGLISLYAIYRQNCFGRVASISGSLWYPGFVHFMQNNTPCRTDVRVLLLSGRIEGAGDPPPLCNSVKYLQQAHLLLKKQLPHDDIPIIWDDGGHADNLSLRFKKALQWVCVNSILPRRL